MPEFKVAHLYEQGQNLLVFPLDSNIHLKSDSDKADILDELEIRAHAAGLAGGAVIIWQHGRHTHFMGPQQWHPFLKGLAMRDVLANVNREISW